MQHNFKSIQELILGFKRGDRLLSDMFSKRNTLGGIRYDDAVETLGGNEQHVRYLIDHGMIIESDGVLELDDVYRQFFENILEVNEDINVASVQTYVDRLRLSINSYLAADSDRRKQQFQREVRHTFRSIAQTTYRNVVDLKRNVDDTYKQEPDYKIKKLRLNDFDQKRRQIGELIRQTEHIMDEQTIFFATAMDTGMQTVVNEVQQSLHDSSHGLIDIERQIIDYLNRIEYQSRFVKKIRRLKYLSDQCLLQENSDVEAVLAQHDDVWMEPQTKYKTKVSLDFLRNDDAAFDILSSVRRSLTGRAAIHNRLSGRIEEKYLQQSEQRLYIINHQEMFNAFKAQRQDLFSFVMNYPLRQDEGREQRLVLFMQLASEYADNIVITDETSHYENILYPIIHSL